MIVKITEYLALLFAMIFLLIAGTSNVGFNFVHFLVVCVNTFDKIIAKLKPISSVIDPGYVKLWLPLIIISALALIPMYGIWFVLRKKL